MSQPSKPQPGHGQQLHAPATPEDRARADKMAKDQASAADAALAKVQGGNPKADNPVPGSPADIATAKAAAEAEAKRAIQFISAPVILSPDLAKVTAPVNARDEVQQAMDATVKQLHDKWVKAGRPSAWGNAVNAKVVATYFIKPEDAEDHKKLITKAARFLGHTIRWGSSFQASAEMVKKYSLPTEYEGREVISFFVKDTNTRKPRTDSQTSTDAGTQASANTSTQGG